MPKKHGWPEPQRKGKVEQNIEEVFADPLIPVGTFLTCKEIFHRCRDDISTEGIRVRVRQNLRDPKRFPFKGCVGFKNPDTEMLGVKKI